ncbi:hypothetical protein N9139_02315, partial [Akkermansiaceae bacterium]|nr:hypothetical protein [Akkermansiaceae bacterium]
MSNSIKESEVEKWLVCTPKDFVGNSIHFARDSGLLCKGFQEIGIPCKAILPGEKREDDNSEDLIRTHYKNLESKDWWEEQGAYGVVFYGWGAGKYRKVAKAIKDSGSILVSHMDTGGILGPLSGLKLYLMSRWRISQGESKDLLNALIAFGPRTIYDLTGGLIWNDWRRSRHLKLADVIGSITPIALERIQKLCHAYGGEDLASNVKLIPHPNASYMKPDPNITKENLVISIGRWDDRYVKGTSLLLETSGRILQNNHNAIIEIYGKLTDELLGWRQDL